ncbi:hypothetical protein EYF80_063208 [Liparis tanakae]|uniref:Uncharacterized protein n=1 Tax=Liparis tanakae TaxID=230148 RepID=A0A4Z2ECS1_9TELE|nr:hypothetical protein EYF80_063208 [Liparis tanakae]
MSSLGAVGELLSGTEKQTLGQVPCPVYVNGFGSDWMQAVLFWCNLIGGIWLSEEKGAGVGGDAPVSPQVFKCSPDLRRTRLGSEAFTVRPSVVFVEEASGTVIRNRLRLL